MLERNRYEMHTTVANIGLLFKLPMYYFWWAVLHALKVSLIFFPLNSILNNYLREKVVLGRAGLKY